jgi:uncharacterized membrane protein YfcA
MFDFLRVTFPVSGVTTWVFIPPLVAFLVSFVTSMGGVSGAFLLLPFQMSVLNFVSPAVSSTNHVFNLVAIPSGVWRYMQEKRLVWPLTAVVVGGDLFGVVLGVWVRLAFLPDPALFKFFVGWVLLIIGAKLGFDLVTAKSAKGHSLAINPEKQGSISDVGMSWKSGYFRFAEQHYTFPVPVVLLLAFVVGIIGGVYGIGGGAIIAPIFVSFLHLPIYAVAGAALLGTFITSLAAVVTFTLIAPAYPAMAVSPDWLLGILFGIGGFAGMYLGARCQKFVPERIIKIFLLGCVLFISMNYIIGFWL